jgi:ThiF family/Prokaryotic homologs of the JAB domain
MSRTVTLRLTGDQNAAIRRHLFPGDGKEAAVIALCGRGDPADACRLLVREIHPVPYEVCTVRAPDQMAWPVSWLDPLLMRVDRENLSLVKFHGHGGDFRRFSATDDRSDRRLFDGIRDWLDRDLLHASVVMMGDGSMFGRAVDAADFIRVNTVAVVGDDLRFWHHNAPVLPEPLKGVGRRTAAFGEQMTAELAQLSLAIVGASGTGSIMLEQAGRLGFGRIVTIDPQSAERRNLNRIVNASCEDAAKEVAKVEIARRAVEAMGLGTKVQTFHCDLVTREAVEAVAGCDIIIGCVDSAEGRDVLNRISTWYVLPYIDVGVRIVALPDGTIDQVNGAIHYIQPGRSSLLSRRAYRHEQVAADGMRRRDPARYAALRREKYIEGADEDAPAVITVNMLMASLAMNELLARLYPIRNAANRGYATLRVSLTETVIEPEPEGDPCPVLARHLGAGDMRPPLDLPELSA